MKARLTITMDQRVYRRLKMYAAGTGATVSSIIEDLVRKFLRERGWLEER